ncbi:hypothetical protein MJM45_27695, partial [Salmonella enterica subsp. enterica serovar Kentucky]|nr:hypothetical protein [Salmonella enterica subsp. enterica serovar Kentucky]
LLVGFLQQGLQMAGVPNQISSALSGALLIVVVVGRSVSLHRHLHAVVIVVMGTGNKLWRAGSTAGKLKVGHFVSR